MTKDQDYFSNLPDEMVLNILLFLDYDSMLSARICCSRFETILSEILEERSQFKLDRWRNFKLARDDPEHVWVFKTNKKFKHLCFNEVNFDEVTNSDFDEFWNLHGENVVGLQLKYCKVDDEKLYKILDAAVNLKHLKLGLSRDIDGGKIINRLYDRCVEITFTSTTYIEKNEIETISADRKTAIEELNLEYMRFHDSQDETRAFRETGVYKLLKLIHSNLKRFELFPCFGDENILQQLAELNLNLESFKIYFNDEIDNSIMLRITSQMKNLQKLDINGTVFSDENANVIYDNLHELRSLTFRECDILSNDGIINVTKLKKLEEFEATTCQNLSNRGIVHGIASSTNRVLKRLTLYQHFSDDTLIAVVNNLPELTMLQIATCLYFSPHLIPLIYERLPKLTTLFVSSLNSPREADYFENPIEVEKTLSEPVLKNSDIQVDALVSLTSLHINSFPGIPGASIQAISKLKHLRDLSLHSYEEISKEDVIHLLQNCRTLRKIEFRFCNELLASVEDRQEEFTINTCQNVTNRGIVNGIASKENHTLKRLDLYERFSDDTLIAIVNNLPDLEALYISTILFFSSHLIPLIYERLTNLKEFCINALNEPEDAHLFEEQEVAKNLSEPKLNNSDVRISQLSKLLVLQIYGYKAIPGTTLRDISQIPKLRHLTLHNYEAINKHEIIHLLTTLKSLRKIDLRHCTDFIENEVDRDEIRAAKTSKTDFIFNFDKI